MLNIFKRIHHRNRAYSADVFNENYYIEQVRRYAIGRSTSDTGYYHGIGHWDRVAENAEKLKDDGVDIIVVKVFAYIHDVERINENRDSGHGERAAQLVDEIRTTVLGFMSDQQIDLLKEACALHTDVRSTGNQTIDTCFDADRLDLGRVGITPDPNRMATNNGKRIAEMLNDGISYNKNHISYKWHPQKNGE